MSSSTRLAIDVGSVRIGVAAAPPDAGLAFPVETVARGAGDVERICALARERDAVTIFVGDPLTLAGDAGAAATDARGFARQIAEALPQIDVRLVDERLTTVMSQRSLADAGRNTRKARNVVDQAAAVAILQNALDTERATGVAAGVAVRTQGSGI